MRNKWKTLVLAGVAMVFTTEALATTWNVSLWGKRRAFTENTEKLKELVEQKTDGGFKLNISYGGLLKNRENLDGISLGAIEMGQFCAGYHRDKNPTITVLELPFLGVETLEQEVALSMALYQHPAVKADLARWNATLLMPSAMPQYNLAGVGTPPSSLEDLKGQRMRATGGIGQAMAAMGAVPTSMTATEVYNALESGLVDSVSFAPHAHVSFRVMDVAEWWTTNLNPGTLNCPVVVNNDALAALSDEHRDALMSSVDEAMAYYVENYNATAQADLDRIIDEKGLTRVTFPQAEIDSAKAAIAGPAHEKWVADMEKRGVPGKELLDFVKAELAK